MDAGIRSASRSGTAATESARGAAMWRVRSNPPTNLQSAIECLVHSLATALGLSLVGSCGGLLVASSLVLFSDAMRKRVVPWLVSYAVGALLGVALLALLPEALGVLAPASVFGTLLGGIMLFFVLEKLVLLRHCHTDDCEVHAAAAPLVLIGDGFHNFI